MVLSAAQMAQMSRLLDEALELDEPARLQWLDALAPEHRELEAALRVALRATGGAASAELATLPKVNAGATPIASGAQAGELVGPYRLIRLLGSGGMAEVWLAQRADGAFKREVALKLPMLSSLRKDLPSRFARERDILAGLEHANIARMYDAGVTKQGVPYLALEYVAGKSLLAWADDHRLGIRERIELFLQVLGAVQYAHDRGVLHRDIKPSNVLVTDDGQVRLLDFGVAKLLQQESESGLTRVYGRAFTPEYASPEHIQGEPLQPSSDVYSLGVVLYELLAGSRPHRIKAADSARLLEEAANRPPAASPSAGVGPEAGAPRATTQKKLARQLRGDLDAIVLKAVAAAPEERYGSAAALADDLRRQLRGEPVTARPAYLSYRFSRFMRRHRAGAAAVVVAATAGSYLWTVTERTLPTSAALGDRPIAVLPFVALPTDDKSMVQGVSFARDLSAALGRTLAHFAWRVVESPVTEKQTDPDGMQHLGSRLNASYLIGGEIGHADGQIRVDIQIIDGATGTRIWADRVETPELKAARFPDLALLRTTAVLRRGIYKIAEHRIVSKPLDLLTPAEMVLLANETEDQEAKVRLYAEALLRVPNLVPALVGWADRLRVVEASAAENERNLEQADGLSKRAIQLAPNDADAWYVRGWVLWHQDRYDAALTANAKAIELDPSYAKSYVARGLYTISIGQPEAALAMLDRARDIDSTVDGVASRTACRAFLSLGRYDEAVQNCERAMATDESLFAHIYLTAAYAQKGDMARAADAKATLLRLSPRLTLEALKRHSGKPDIQRFREQWDKHIIAGLRKAGIPER
jgi:serine/threonine protein kinase/TolB-like protein/Tfp pilus assembly protein PilF